MVRAEGEKDAAGKRSVSAAIVLAENDGYRAAGALPCQAGTAYVFSFWYKGDVASATVAATGWASAGADDKGRISIPIVAEALRPGAEWRQCTGLLRIPESVTRFVVMVQTGGRESAGDYAISTQDLANRIPGRVWFETQEETAAYVMQNAQPGDLAVTLGCGDIYKCAHMMLADGSWGAPASGGPA